MGFQKFKVYTIGRLLFFLTNIVYHSEFTSEIARSKAGTTLYMAPEVFKRKYSNKVDVWSLGVCGYEMVSFSLPFANEAEILDLNFNYTNLSASSFPYLVPFVHKMINRDVFKRPSAVQMLEEIESQQPLPQQQHQQQAGTLFESSIVLNIFS